MADNETNWPEMMWLAARGEPWARNWLDELREKNPSLCSSRIREFILSDDYDHEMGTCDLLNVLAKVDGVEAVEAWITAEWPNCGTAAKRKICNWAYVHNGMPTDLALALFNNSASSVQERHFLTVGLACTARERNSQSIVLELIDRIGSYDDPQRQETLESFIEGVRDSFE